MLKKITLVILACILSLSFPIHGNASLKPIEIYINDVKIESDVPPIIVDNRTLVPVRLVSENLGAEVFWNNDKRLVEVITHSKTIVFDIDGKKAYVNGQEVYLDVPAQIVNDRTMVPLRFIGETFGAEVDWDNDLRRVIIANQSGAKIIDFSYENIQGKPSVIIKGDKSLEYNVIEIKEENRLAIDITGRMDTMKNALYIYDNYLDKAIAGEIFSEPPVTRIVLELQPGVAYRTYQSEDKKSVILTFENIVEDITIENNKDEFIVNLKTTNPSQMEYFFLTDPDRLVLDISDTMLGHIEPPKVSHNDYVKNIRFGQFTESTFRTVFDLKKDINYQVFQNGNVYSVVFSDVNTVENVEVTSQTDMDIIEIHASGEIGYELKADRNKRQLKIVVPSIAVSEKLMNQNVINVRDNIIDNIQLVKVKGIKNYNIEIVVNLNTFTSYEMLSSPPSDIIRLALHRSPLKNKLIVIDPGHGGSEPGAVVGSIMEKDLNLDISLKLKALLEANGVMVQMTRDDDTFVNLYTRAGIANELDADLFISIHNNSAGSGATGTETLYYPRPENAIFAQAIQNAMARHVGLKDRGIVERPGVVVTRETKMLSALVEVAFMTNENDLALLMTDEFRQKAAEGIFQGIMDYLSGRTD